ncbi:transposable element Tcb2 transposase [Trichonephila clavipes]|nr:transposable element Tcb2 transposase [Trichonephila clavipes]
MGAEFLFMDDHARPHLANIVDECLQSEDITRMNCPAYSPDLNPIEHVWDMPDRRIAARHPPPTCLLELRRALLDEWCNIPQDQVDNLILSMPRHSFFFWGHMMNLVNASPVESDEELVTRIAVVAGDIWELPWVFANVQQSLRWRCQACIFAGLRAIKIFFNEALDDMAHSSLSSLTGVVVIRFSLFPGKKNRGQ